jgi:predicted DNA-binding mobile mystery protein A
MAQFNQSALAQLDSQLMPLRKAANQLAHARPRSGWVSALRHALGMSGAALARRMGMTRGAVYKLEANEVDESISVASLRRAAQALDADFVYAIIPRAPLRKMINERAREAARDQLTKVAATMGLEAQTLTKQQIEDLAEIIAAKLEKTPSSLWP